MRIEMDSLLTKLGYWEIQMLKNQIHWICKQYITYVSLEQHCFLYLQRKTYCNQFLKKVTSKSLDQVTKKFQVENCILHFYRVYTLFTNKKEYLPKSVHPNNTIFIAKLI